MGQALLQSETAFLYYNLGEVSKNGAVFITKRSRYYEVRLLWQSREGKWEERGRATYFGNWRLFDLPLICVATDSIPLGILENLKLL